MTDIKEFVLIPGVSDAIRTINQSEYLVVVVSNQPVIARGEVSIDELNHIHDKMETLLRSGWSISRCYLLLSTSS